MSVDYPGAIDMMLPLSYSYNFNDHLEIVEHCTGGNLTLQSIYNTFLSTMRSTHFGIDANGQVAQFVPLARGAGGNCCIEPGCDPLWTQLTNQYGNLNLCTISIEHCNNSSQSLPMTPAQLLASQKLNLWLCQRYKLDSSNVWYHSSIDPATNCPGTLFLQNSLPAIKSYVTKGLSMPAKLQQFRTAWLAQAGMNSDGTTWKAFESGIFNVTYQAHDAGLISFVVPVTGERNNVDWDGTPMIIQHLSGGYTVWRNGVGYVYNDQDQLVFKGSYKTL